MKSPSSYNYFKSRFLQTFQLPSFSFRIQSTEVNTSLRYTTKAITGSPILFHLFTPTMYANLYIQPSDSDMSDFMLLHTILSHTERFEHTLTLWPGMNGNQCCFSFHIFGNGQRQIRADAIDLVDNWTCSLGVNGPPYFRAMVFSSER